MNTCLILIQPKQTRSYPNNRLVWSWLFLEVPFDWPRLLYPFYITPLSEWSCSPYTADRDGCLQWKSWNNNPSSFHHQIHPLILNSGQDLVNLRLSVIPQRSRHLWPSLPSVDCFSGLDHKGGFVNKLILFWLWFLFFSFFFRPLPSGFKPFNWSNKWLIIFFSILFEKCLFQFCNKIIFSYMYLQTGNKTFNVINLHFLNNIMKSKIQLRFYM